MRIACGVTVFVVLLSLVARVGETREISTAYAEVKRAGGEPFPNHPSRIVFRDAKFTAADLDRLIPYLKTIPIGSDVSSNLPDCRALDFTATPAITESHVYPLMTELEMTIIFFYTTSGRGQCVKTIDLQQAIATDNFDTNTN